ncbi:MAG: hypothetical protein OJF49_002024 [Ktedonobacterales bacterium]|jgi:TrmH family RNA methyltransferase|nr:MAG: hypothetical protein OJF49_002024 [Ktedonobacterales bacterium]
MDTLTSIKDARVVEARALSSASGRARLGRCLLEGAEALAWALDAALPVEHVFLATRFDDATGILARVTERGIPCFRVSDGVLKKITETTYLVPLVAVARLPAPATPGDTMGDLVVVLDHVVDYGNIGTIVRTASAFGVRDLMSTTPDPDLYYKKIISASRGTVFGARFTRFASGTETIESLKRRGYQIVATSSHARDIQALARLAPMPVALVVGNERDGVSDEILRRADMVVQIPMSGSVESLNVGVATGISLYEMKMRMVFAMLVDLIRANFGREVNVTGRMILTAFDAVLRNVSNLNGTQVILLMMLKCDEAMTPAQITRETATLEDELDDLLVPLLAGHYIIREEEADRVRYRLASEGERALAALWPVVERAEQEVLAGFGDEERTQLTGYLKRIQENCTRMLAE